MKDQRKYFLFYGYIFSLMSFSSLQATDSPGATNQTSYLSLAGVNSDTDSSFLWENQHSQSDALQIKKAKEKAQHGFSLSEKLQGLDLLKDLGMSGNVLAQVAYLEMGKELGKLTEKVFPSHHEEIEKNKKNFYEMSLKSLDSSKDKAKNHARYLTAKAHYFYGHHEKAKGILKDLLEEENGLASYFVATHPELHPKEKLTQKQIVSLLQNSAESLAPSPKAFTALGDQARMQGDYTKARFYYLKAYHTPQGHAYGALGLGLLASQQDDNLSQALHYFQEAAENHHPMGMIATALLYWEGKGGIPRDVSKTLSYLKEAANEHHHSTAAALLAQAYLEGWDGKIDLKKSKLYLDKALKKKDPYAYHVAGLTLKEKYLDQQNQKPTDLFFEEAETYFRKASKLHISESDVELGYLYLSQNRLGLAEASFLKGHQKKNPHATYMLGVLYKSKKNSKDENHRQALKLLVQAGHEGILTAKLEAAALQRELQNTGQEFQLLDEAFRMAEPGSYVYQKAAARLSEMYEEGTALNSHGDSIQDKDRSRELKNLSQK